eukprot:770388-Rhodomonas_salina.1
MDLGWRAEEMENVFCLCPQRLRSALDRLSCVVQSMIRNQAAKLKPLPEVDDMFESARVVRAR